MKLKLVFGDFSFWMRRNLMTQVARRISCEIFTLHRQKLHLSTRNSVHHHGVRFCETVLHKTDVLLQTSFSAVRVGKRTPRGRHKCKYPATKFRPVYTGRINTVRPEPSSLSLKTGSFIPLLLVRNTFWRARDFRGPVLLLLRASPSCLLPLEHCDDTPLSKSPSSESKHYTIAKVSNRFDAFVQLFLIQFAGP